MVYIVPTPLSFPRRGAGGEVVSAGGEVVLLGCEVQIIYKEIFGKN
jgi:hypothetical protein